MLIIDWSSDVCASDLAILGPQRHKVWRAALELAGIFDQHDPVGGFGDLGEQRVRERRFAGASAPSDKDVQPLCNARTKTVGFSCKHDSCADVVLEQKHRDGGLADGKGGSRHHRWQEAFRSEEHTSELQSIMRISYAV